MNRRMLSVGLTAAAALNLASTSETMHNGASIRDASPDKNVRHKPKSKSLKRLLRNVKTKI